MPKPVIMDESSLESFDEITCSGLKDKRLAQALDLVERMEGSTARELFNLGLDLKYYHGTDLNQIKPRLTELMRRYGKIVSPYKRPCILSSNQIPVNVYYLNTSERGRVFQLSSGPQVQHYQKIRSKSEGKWVNHDVFYWKGGTVECSCKGFRRYGHCHNATGMRLMVTGNITDGVAPKVGQ